MTHKRDRLLALLSIPALLFLQGCGGGSASGISQDVYDALRADYEQAVADRNAAVAAHMTAESAARAAMDEHMDADAGARAAIEAQRVAETWRDRAVAAQAAAEEARASAETAKREAQTAATAAAKAQINAETQAAKARRDKVVAETALALAALAATDAREEQTTAEAARMKAEAALVKAVGDLAIAESDARAAVEAQIRAEEGLKAVLANLSTAEAAQKTAEAAVLKARDDLNAVLAAQVKAEEGLAKTEIERDAALAVLAMQREAEAAQRARVDALAIKASAGFTIVTGGVDLNGDGRYDPAGVPGEILPAGRSSTHTVANYQGAQDRLLNLPAESLSVRASRSGSLVSVSATVRQGGDRKQLFRVSSGTVAEDTTSIAEQVRVPGGHTNHIFLMTDIEAPVPVPSPTGLTRTRFDSDYLVYGAWLMRPDSTGGTSYSAAFATGNDLFDPTAAAGENGLAGLVGKATYKGSAAGFFAEQFVNVDTAASGTFTAAAEFSADFGAITANNDAAGGIISGTISNFLRSDGVLVNWLINLGTLALGAVDGIPSATNTAVTSAAAGGFTPGTTSGNASGVPWVGEWGVQFVGDDAVFSARHPTGVVGTFGAQYGSPVRLTGDPPSIKEFADLAFVAVIGAFGARK